MFSFACTVPNSKKQIPRDYIFMIVKSANANFYFDIILTAIYSDSVCFSTKN